MLENWPRQSLLMEVGVATVWSQPQGQTQTGEKGKDGERIVRCEKTNGSSV